MQIYLLFPEAQPNFCVIQLTLKLVQAERKCKFQRANVKKKLAFSLLSEAEIQRV